VSAKRQVISPHPDRPRFTPAVDPPPPGEGNGARVARGAPIAAISNAAMSQLLQNETKKARDFNDGHRIDHNSANSCGAMSCCGVLFGRPRSVYGDTRVGMHVI
jgi:hypothetical protein